jgi:DNA-binding response OmpR family regulator
MGATTRKGVEIMTLINTTPSEEDLVARVARPIAKIRVLVVDDNQAIRKLLEDILVMEGFEVRTACDGEEGLLLYQEFCPELLMTDIKMPKKNGFELVAELREKDPNLPIIYVSGSVVNGSDAEKLKKELVDHPDYQIVVKPFGLAAILKAVERASKRSPAREAQKDHCSAFLLSD